MLLSLPWFLLLLMLSYGIHERELIKICVSSFLFLNFLIINIIILFLFASVGFAFGFFHNRRTIIFIFYFFVLMKIQSVRHDKINIKNRRRVFCVESKSRI